LQVGIAGCCGKLFAVAKLDILNVYDMSISKIYALIGSLVFLITSAYGTGNADSLYKVLKVKTKGDYYIIHAQRNNSLFKIVSKKKSPDTKPNLEQLRKGKSYRFDFSSINNDTAKIGTVPLNGNASYLHVKNSRFFIIDKTRIKFEERFHYRIYVTRNLIGLYYSRWPV